MLFFVFHASCSGLLHLRGSQNILPLLDSCERSKGLERYLIMPRVRWNLHEMITLAGSDDFVMMTDGLVRIRLASDIASGLLHMAEKGVCHCDLKPANVVRLSRGRVHVRWRFQSPGPDCQVMYSFSNSLNDDLLSHPLTSPFQLVGEDLRALITDFGGSRVIREGPGVPPLTSPDSFSSGPSTEAFTFHNIGSPGYAGESRSPFRSSVLHSPRFRLHFFFFFPRRVSSCRFRFHTPLPWPPPFFFSSLSLQLRR